MTRTAYILPVLLLFLAGCAGVAPPQPKPPVESAAEIRERAREAVARGEFVDAARLYRRLAEAAEPSRRNELWLRAATARVRAGQLAEAEADLGRLDRTALSATGRMQLQLLEAERALLRHRPERALDLLAVPKAPEVEAALQAEYHALRARAHSQLEQPIESARERVLRGHYLQDPLEIEINRDAIWNALSAVEPEVLKRREGDLRDTLGGWLALARLARVL
ncbi:MAG TPA: penicillin-binding protein activator, partial [Gammaproteobacteria bacterium]|nr:penicillin-binding protein activator [Gammaproteobacteria bacterium]